MHRPKDPLPSRTLVGLTTDEPDPAKFIDLMMLVMLGGQERTTDEYERLYAEAGFRLTNIIRTGSLLDIIEGVPV